MNPIDSFEAMPLAEPIKRALREKQYTQPTPIQAQAIPHLVDGADLMGSAQTGTGKTAAFALPALHHFITRPQRCEPNRMRALILTPTRELAEQVANSFDSYGQHARLSCLKIFGGVNQSKQTRGLQRGVDCVVATPGRLIDLWEQGHIDFSRVEYFVLDEADRMLDMGFINDIRKIIKQLPKDRQSVFFSATLSPKITQLAESILTEPVEVRIEPEKHTADAVDHRLCYLHAEHKNDLLLDMLSEQTADENAPLTLVFSRTKHGADKLCKFISRNGIPSESIHGNKTQAARRKALENFRTGKAPVLVATDVAARGIDVKNVTLVINYDLPDEPEAYVHRIGRTARGGAQGRAISFCTSATLGELASIEKLIKASITVEREHDYHVESIHQRRQRISHRSPKPQQQSKRRGQYKARAKKPFGKRLSRQK